MAAVTTSGGALAIRATVAGHIVDVNVAARGLDHAAQVDDGLLRGQPIREGAPPI